jgi:rubrerythrin
MSEKPSYLGLLNAISNAEGEAECYLSAWAQTTPRDDVRQIISTIALREGEHSKAFAKRVCELGYSVQPRPDAKTAERTEIAASSTLTDREKFEKLGLGRPEDMDKPDIFSTMFQDKTIDIQTGALLGRYIAEERDSGRLSEECYGQLCSEENGSVASSSALGDDRLSRIECLLEELVNRLPAASAKRK